MSPLRPAWSDGPLLPPGWRPDREEPRDDRDEHRWVAVDPAGRLRLADGTDVALRPFSPGDGGLLVAGFARLSAQSRYRRFLAPMPHLTDSMLAFLTSVDGVNHRAWGALVEEPVGPAGTRTVGAGVVRWVRTKADAAVADMAVTVIDDYQGRGLGGLLLDVAVLDAFAHGIERFEGVVLGENVASRRMLARGGATLRPDGGGVLSFTLALRPRSDRLRSGSSLPAVVAAAARRAPLAT
ncbi:MAG TPA: GNAT family N-acetyltransferase [Acidimicrobiia bacterium]|nr:GNAT family N-acetyltransferase [Acidimicrobiia bacterium]